MVIHKVAVLGAGNGGVAAAADLALRDYDVRLFSRSQSTLQPILDRGGIELVEEGRESFAKPGLVSSDIGKVVSGADLVMIVAPSVAHDWFASVLVPLLSDGQVILLNPGHTGGSLHLASLFRTLGLKAKVLICETVTLTYICRLKAPARVEIYRRTNHLRFAAFPSRFTSDLIRAIGGIYSNVVPAEHVLETGLANINAVMHPAGMLGNAGWIERSSGDFYFYREGITPAIANIIAKVDQERLRIVRRLSLPPLGFVEIFYQAGLTSEAARSSNSVLRAIRESTPNHSIKSPPSLDHRYLHEDVAYGLVPMAEIARLVEVDTPVIEALIALAAEVNQRPYRSEGLTLEKMGLARVKPENLKELLREGF